jgi:hypothetical protein
MIRPRPLARIDGTTALQQLNGAIVFTVNIVVHSSLVISSNGLGCTIDAMAALLTRMSTAPWASKMSSTWVRTAASSVTSQ